MSCASKEIQRPRPVKILDCPELTKQILERDRFFSSIRGSASIKSGDFSFDADVAATSPAGLRVEVSGALGVKIGLLVMNEKWVKFVVPREKLVLRIPRKELDENTIRSERFLSAVVLPLPPHLLVEAVTTQSLLASGAKVLACRYSHEHNWYELKLADSLTKGGAHLYVDPSTLAPLQVLRFDSFLPNLDDETSQRFSYRIQFSHLQGSGLATIPARAELTSRKMGLGQESKTELRWSQVQAWSEATMASYEFSESSIFRVKDY